LGKVGSIVGVWVEQRCGSHLLPEVAAEATLSILDSFLGFFGVWAVFDDVPLLFPMEK
jgi:hypothetical protein